MEKTAEKATQDEQAELNAPIVTFAGIEGINTGRIPGVDHPNHYNWFGIECIDVVEHFGFNTGNAIKYIWRAEYKDDPIEDLQAHSKQSFMFYFSLWMRFYMPSIGCGLMLTGGSGFVNGHTATIFAISFMTMN
jgi:hypothetical protein